MDGGQEHGRSSTPRGRASTELRGRRLPLPTPQPVDLDDQPTPRAAHWPAERGRAARCPDCRTLVQQYPRQAGGWVVLNAAPVPGPVVPAAARWSVDGQGVAAPSPAATGAVRIEHRQTCLACDVPRTGQMMMVGRPRAFRPGPPEEPVTSPAIRSVPARVHVDRQVVVREASCPACGTPPGVPCRRSSGYRSPRKRPHPERIEAWRSGAL